MLRDKCAMVGHVFRKVQWGGEQLEFTFQVPDMVSFACPPTLFCAMAYSRIFLHAPHLRLRVDIHITALLATIAEHGCPRDCVFRWESRRQGQAHKKRLAAKAVWQVGPLKLLFPIRYQHKIQLCVRVDIQMIQIYRCINIILSSHIIV